jgi:hypothetical protein
MRCVAGAAFVKAKGSGIHYRCIKRPMDHHSELGFTKPG